MVSLMFNYRLKTIKKLKETKKTNFEELEKTIKELEKISIYQIKCCSFVPKLRCK